MQLVSGRMDVKMKIKQTKAQMKIQQMTFMLIAVTLFFVLVGMFLLVIKFSDIKQSATELCEKNAQLLTTKLANSPEFSCGEAFGTLKTNCIDADKAMALKENIGKYRNFWDVSNIEIRKIYPAGSEKICEEGNYPDCNLIRLRSEDIEGVYLSNFVSLCRKESYDGIIYNKCELAKLMINYQYGEEC